MLSEVVLLYIAVTLDCVFHIHHEILWFNIATVLAHGVPKYQKPELNI
jgi:hypothetical protein